MRSHVAQVVQATRYSASSGIGLFFSVLTTVSAYSPVAADDEAFALSKGGENLGSRTLTIAHDKDPAASHVEHSKCYTWPGIVPIEFKDMVSQIDEFLNLARRETTSWSLKVQDQVAQLSDVLEKAMGTVDHEGIPRPFLFYRIQGLVGDAMNTAQIWSSNLRGLVYQFRTLSEGECNGPLGRASHENMIVFQEKVSQFLEVLKESMDTVFDGNLVLEEQVVKAHFLVGTGRCGSLSQDSECQKQVLKLQGEFLRVWGALVRTCAENGGSVGNTWGEDGRPLVCDYPSSTIASGFVDDTAVEGNFFPIAMMGVGILLIGGVATYVYSRFQQKGAQKMKGQTA